MSTNRIKSRRMSGAPVRTALLGVCLLLFAASCGQRGPLYLPKPDAGAGSAAPVNVEAAEDADGQTAGDEAAGDGEDGDEETP